MYLRKIKNKQTGRIYISIVESYREKETQKNKSRTIQSLGYLDELQQQYSDPIEHFEKVIKEMNLNKASENIDILVKYKSNDKLSIGTNNRKNFGYAAFSSIYHTL